MVKGKRTDGVTQGRFYRFRAVRARDAIWSWIPALQSWATGLRVALAGTRGIPAAPAAGYESLIVVVRVALRGSAGNPIMRDALW